MYMDGNFNATKRIPALPSSLIERVAVINARLPYWGCRSRKRGCPPPSFHTFLQTSNTFFFDSRGQQNNNSLLFSHNPEISCIVYNPLATPPPSLSPTLGEIRREGWGIFSFVQLLFSLPLFALSGSSDLWDRNL